MNVDIHVYLHLFNGGINESRETASKSSWESQDFGDVNMGLKLAFFSQVHQGPMS